MTLRHSSAVTFTESLFISMPAAVTSTQELFLTAWLVIIVVLVALWYAGVLRPTGLAGRTRAEEERERQQDAVSKWLKKDGEDRPL